MVAIIEKGTWVLLVAVVALAVGWFIRTEKPEGEEPAGGSAVWPAGGKNSLGQVMVRIEPGTFLMGAPPEEDGRQGDETQHRVTLRRPFLLGATEVTQGQWQDLFGANPSRNTSCGRDCPVESVTWFDAIRFCNALSTREHLPRCYTVDGAAVRWDQTCAGYRLPTEAEWEYAARAGTTGPRYGELEEIAWYGGNKEGRIHPVGLKVPNAWGLYDLLGNVWEWVFDVAGAYPTGSGFDPSGPAEGPTREFRGGCWSYYEKYCRAAYRQEFVPDKPSEHLGFRVARSL